MFYEERKRVQNETGGHYTSTYYSSFLARATSIYVFIVALKEYMVRDRSTTTWLQPWLASSQSSPSSERDEHRSRLHSPELPCTYVKTYLNGWYVLHTKVRLLIFEYIYMYIYVPLYKSITMTAENQERCLVFIHRVAHHISRITFHNFHLHIFHLHTSD